MSLLVYTHYLIILGCFYVFKVVRELVQITGSTVAEIEVSFIRDSDLKRHFSREDTQMSNKNLKKCSIALSLRKCRWKPQ